MAAILRSAGFAAGFSAEPDFGSNEIGPVSSTSVEAVAGCVPRTAGFTTAGFSSGAGATLLSKSSSIEAVSSSMAGAECAGCGGRSSTTTGAGTGRVFAVVSDAATDVAGGIGVVLSVAVAVAGAAVLDTMVPSGRTTTVRTRFGPTARFLRARRARGRCLIFRNGRIPGVWQNDAGDFPARLSALRFRARHSRHRVV